MVVLGICGGHDANWCIFKDGKLIGAFEKERFSRIRHDEGYVMDLVDKTLENLGISFDEVSLIATSEANFKGTDPGLHYINKRIYDEPDQWVDMQVEYHGRIIPCFAIPHHLCHAAYSYYASNEDESVVLTWDGGGDFYTTNAYTSTSISYWKNKKIQWFERVGNSDLGSLWHIYSKVIFQNPFAAGKLMGLAAVGNDSLVKAFSDYALRPVRGKLEPSFSIKNCWPDEDYPMFRDVNNWELSEAANIAYAVQDITIKAGIELANRAYSVSDSKTLCLGGGCALNGYLNTELSKKTSFEKIFVPPSVHDGGLSIGAVMFTMNNIMGLVTQNISEDELVFNGLDYSDDDCVHALREAGLEWRVLDSNEIHLYAADQLRNGKIVAWYEGKSEHGPRALGHRSFLADPRFPEMKDRLNNTVKFRESFRPIAPVVLESDMRRCSDDIERSPFMMHIVTTTEEFQRVNPSAIHIDGSARVQTVNDNNPMEKIIRCIKDWDGGYSILNTSFNCREPIVETPLDAVHTFLKVPVDVLCLNGKYCVERG